MPTEKQIYDYFDSFAPFKYSDSYDNTGIIVKSTRQNIENILLALDITEDVVNEAAEGGFHIIVTHHPIIFQPLKCLDLNSPLGLLAEFGIGVISLHTNLDVAKYGVSDILAERLGLENLGIPIEVIDGKIGYGRICNTDKYENVQYFVNDCATLLHCKAVRYYDSGREIRRVAVGSGACGSLLEKLPNNVDAFITGDVKHSQFLKAKELGITLIDAGHFYTEYVCLEYLQKKIIEKFPEVTAVIAENSVDITEYY